MYLNGMEAVLTLKHLVDFSSDLFFCVVFAEGLLDVRLGSRWWLSF